MIVNRKKHLENGEKVGVIFMDLSTTFDTINDSFNQSIIQSINQSINQSLFQFVKKVISNWLKITDQFPGSQFAAKYLSAKYLNEVFDYHF